jgi:hypothetical protein
MVNTTEQLYQERFSRIQKVISLGAVNHVPVIFQGMAFAPRYLGMSMADFCADPEAPVNTSLAAMDKIGGFDGINTAAVGKNTALVPAMWLSRISVPGRELPPDSIWQVQEAEIMTTDDYDFIINKGWPAFLNAYLPRVTDVDEFRKASDGKGHQCNIKRYREQVMLLLVWALLTAI